MKHLVVALLAAGSMMIMTDTAEAGHRISIARQRAAVNRAIRQNNAARRQIKANTARLSRQYNRDVQTVLRRDTALDRQFQRTVNSRVRFAPVYGGYGYGAPVGFGVAPRGVGFSTGGFSIFIAR